MKLAVVTSHAEEHGDHHKKWKISLAVYFIGDCGAAAVASYTAAPVIHSQRAANTFYCHSSSSANYPSGWEEEMMLIGRLPRES